jgi:hypothetical protein
MEAIHLHLMRSSFHSCGSSGERVREKRERGECAFIDGIRTSGPSQGLSDEAPQ